MKLLLTIFYLIFFLTSCMPTIIFENDQFSNTPSLKEIPNEFIGDWFGGDKDDESTNHLYIHQDSIEIMGFDYFVDTQKLCSYTPIIDPMVVLGHEPFEDRKKDKIISAGDYVFIQEYQAIFNPDDTSQLLYDGYRIVAAKKEMDGSIKCWDFESSYFLKNKEVDKIPIYKYSQSPENFTAISLKIIFLDDQILRFNEFSNHRYRHFTRNLVTAENFLPMVSTRVFSTDELIAILNKSKPNVILNADKSFSFDKSYSFKKENLKQKRKNVKLERIREKLILNSII